MNQAQFWEALEAIPGWYVVRGGGGGGSIRVKQRGKRVCPISAVANAVLKDAPFFGEEIEEPARLLKLQQKFASNIAGAADTEWNGTPAIRERLLALTKIKAKQRA